MSKRIMYFFIAVALYGCQRDLEFPDGIISDKQMPYVSEFLGTYVGTWRGQPMSFQVALDQRKLWIRKHGEWLDTGCATKAGYLTRLSTSLQSQSYDLAFFGFNPGNCPGMVKGRDIIFELTNRNPKKLRARLLEYITVREECRVADDVTGEWRCDKIERPHYFEGQFTQQKMVL